MRRPSVNSPTRCASAALPASAVAACGFGATRRATPLDLSSSGAPGCSLFIDPFLFINAIISGTGQADVVLAIANDPSLVGVHLTAQWAIVDAVNALNIVVSDASETIIR